MDLHYENPMCLGNQLEAGSTYPPPSVADMQAENNLNNLRSEWIIGIYESL